MPWPISIALEKLRRQPKLKLHVLGKPAIERVSFQTLELEEPSVPKKVFRADPIRQACAYMYMLDWFIHDLLPDTL
jgi:hypothetical protein